MVMLAVLLVAGQFGLALTALVGGAQPAAATRHYMALAGVSALLATLASAQMLLVQFANWPAETTLSIGHTIPGLAIHLRLDAVSAFFLMMVTVPATLVCWFAASHERETPEPKRSRPFFALFLGAMSLVVLADDGFTFLIAWEGMSLASWALVQSNHRQEGTDRAAWLYLVMATGGTVALMVAFGLLAGTAGDLAFDAIRARGHGAWELLAVGTLVLIGCGSKAGIMPLHLWLPLAHAAAPSPVSALMSGVMTKVALYGLIRVLFDLAGPMPWGFGAVLTVLGAVGAVTALVLACLEVDVKRLLAQSTIENIGIVVVGIGLALIYRAFGQPLAAGLALTAAFTHAAGHALFKPLLFCAIGSTVHAVHSRSLDAMGGLQHRMPKLGRLVLIGCLAAMALPPLNGFVSEWLIFQSLFATPDLPQPLLRLTLPAVAALLALAAALAAACFVRLYGIAFLGRARSEAAATSSDAPMAERQPLALLALLCLVLGLVPGLTPLFGSGAVAALLGPGSVSDYGLFSLSTGVGGRGSLAPLTLLLVALVLGIALWLALGLLSPGPVRRARAWDCGTPDASPATQYGAASFGQPLRRSFATSLFGARERVEMPAPQSQEPARLSVELRDPVWHGLYLPMARWVEWAAERLNPLQFLSVRHYLSLSAAALIGLLVLVAVTT
ncbi:MAG: hydrogenase 4 subunit B [Alphaproteobacteria bacterium]|nr:MAG: hydrogenase 4 subunit B [Alphaproteobacteria bacterium]